MLYAPKGIAAADASTGEQKALLIGLVLAHARLIAEMTGIAPVLLLDEVVAHLDPARRAALHAELAQLGAQVWMTGRRSGAVRRDRTECAAIVEVGCRPADAPKQPPDLRDIPVPNLRNGVRSPREPDRDAGS